MLHQQLQPKRLFGFELYLKNSISLKQQQQLSKLTIKAAQHWLTTLFPIHKQNISTLDIILSENESNEIRQLSSTFPQKTYQLISSLSHYLTKRLSSSELSQEYYHLSDGCLSEGECRSMRHYSPRHLHFVYVIDIYILQYHDDNSRYLPSYFRLLSYKFSTQSSHSVTQD